MKTFIDVFFSGPFLKKKNSVQGTGTLRGQGHTGQFCSFLVSGERGRHGDQPLSGFVSGQTGASVSISLSSCAHVPEIQRERSHFFTFNININITDAL